MEEAVRDALKDAAAVLSLVDEKGRRIVVPSGLVAYVEIAEADHRRVGFAVSGRSGAAPDPGRRLVRLARDIPPGRARRPRTHARRGRGPACGRSGRR